MSQFDLIPEDYRRRRSQEQDLIKLASLAVFLVVVALLVSGVLLALITQEKQKFTGLSQQQLSVEEQGNQLKVLDAKILGMAQQLSVLSGFRGGLTAPSLLLALDRSLQEDDVWFSTVEFGRAGSMVDQPQPLSSNGYFILLPRQDKNPAKAWRIDTHMALSGYAHNYVQLSEFVARLLKQPEIDSVRVLRSDLRQFGDWKLVDFELAVIVAAKVAGK